MPYDSEKRYYVYILGSASGTLYTGVTNCIGRRVGEHQHGEGSSYTSRYAVNRLLYFEVFQYINNAIAREKVIKGWRRSKKTALIESMNSGWRDLGQDFGKEFRPQVPDSKRHSSLRSE